MLERDLLFINNPELREKYNSDSDLIPVTDALSQIGYSMNGIQRLILLRVQDNLRAGRCSWPEDGRKFGLDVVIFFDDIKKNTTDAYEKLIVDNIVSMRDKTWLVPARLLKEMPSFRNPDNLTVIEFKPFTSIELFTSQRSISFVLDPRAEWLLSYIPDPKKTVTALSFKLMKEFIDYDDERRLYEILNSRIDGFRNNATTLSVKDLAFLLGYDEHMMDINSLILRIIKNTQYMLDKSKRSEFCYDFKLINVDGKNTYRSARLKEVQFAFRNPETGTLNARFKKPSFDGDTHMTTVTMPVDFYKKLKQLSKKENVRMNILFSEAVADFLAKKGLM